MTDETRENLETAKLIITLVGVTATAVVSIHSLIKLARDLKVQNDIEKNAKTKV